ncbi:MAG: hypothetical protein IJ244_07270 [Bacteroidaceae bacterium]|nr:hypothetical protein [Bacteroidaceae bacterium]
MKKTFKLWMLAALMMSSSATDAWAQESKHEIGTAHRYRTGQQVPHILFGELGVDE